MSKITIKTLAKELQLSVSTVSKAMRDSHEISEETKLRVNELARKLNYVVNPYASSLGSKSSKTIGVVIPEVVDSFFALAINGIESVAQENGYHVLIYLTHESQEKEKNILMDFESGRVDGVLMSVSRETLDHTYIDELMLAGIPFVFFDRVFEDIETTQITTNDYESAYLATQHLLGKGCQQIMFLSFSKNLSISSKRLHGYLDAITAHGLVPDKNDVISFDEDFSEAYPGLKARLQAINRPDGVLASVEKLAIPIYQVCEELNLSIPGNLQIISFSNLETAAYLNPPLTTVTQPAFEIGQAAAAALMKALKRKGSVLIKEEIVIPSTLVIRKSTKT
ncbi:LacI family transcriptional regulator [Pedobacter sp. CAN_A7]|uniref:LacI family DNA-binding transcriptional regulator n=1 Tax=Pedobacter sp. CAN_A7 TaxID=2787722 RepID=UPI0018CA0A8A